MILDRNEINKVGLVERPEVADKSTPTALYTIIKLAEEVSLFAVDTADRVELELEPVMMVENTDQEVDCGMNVSVTIPPAFTQLRNSIMSLDISIGRIIQYLNLTVL